VRGKPLAAAFDGAAASVGELASALGADCALRAGSDG
jgi:hypothetical protein